LPAIQQNQPGVSGANNVPGLVVYAADIITAALRSIQAIEPNESPTAAEMQQCLFTLNQMIDSWQAQRLFVWGIVRYVFAPLVLKQVYTVGPNGDVNIPRPARISAAGVVNLPGSTQPNEIALDMIDELQWRDIPVKNTVGALPIRVWDDNAYPLRNLSYWPIPNVNVNLTLYLWQMITQFADSNFTLYQFPPSYLKAIRYSLAIELAAEFPGEPDKLPIVAALAKEAVGVIKRINKPSLTMACDPALVNSRTDLYNWLTDLPAGR
jgi:hypothetical protein